MSKIKKIIYVSERKFPNGNAGGVRTLHMAKLLKECFSSVKVLSIGDETLNNKYNNLYQGIFFENIGVFKNKYINYILNGLRLVIKTKKITNKMEKNDFILVLYSTNIIFVSFFLFFYDLKKQIAFDVVENFGREKFSKYNIKYYLFQILYKKIYKKARFNFIISKKMEESLLGTDMKNIFIPSIIDPSVYDFENRYLNKQNIKLVYFGSPFGKENVFLMLESFIYLLESNHKNFELHFTGVIIDDFISLSNYNKFSKYLNKNIFIHGWLDSSDLEKLIKKSNFLYFVREESYTNLYNFPTKLAESFALGLPCICNLYGPYSEFLNKNNSIIINKLDPLSISKSLLSINEIIESDYSILCNNARDTSERYFHYKAYSNQLRNFTNEFL